MGDQPDGWSDLCAAVSVGTAAQRRDHHECAWNKQVEYLDGDHIVGQVAGDPTKPWQFDAFLQRVPALEVSMLLILEPVLNAVWAWLVHGETPGPWSFAGCAVILAATIGITLRQRS